MMNEIECYELARNLGWDPSDKEDTLECLRTNWDDPLSEEEVQMTYEALVEIYEQKKADMFDALKDDIDDYLFDNWDVYGLDPEKPILDQVKVEEFGKNENGDMTCSIMFQGDDHWYTVTEKDGCISIDY